MEEFIFNEYMQEIERSTGFSVVNLRELGVKNAAELNFVGVKDKQWSLIEGNSQLRDTLIEKGIYAVGDICSYPGKLKLILSGFHEGALAARACFKLARPNEKYRFEFTTSSKTIKDRLGVKGD